ncbi:dolichol kinase isoform X1 [Tripterygium wilfordii]|uniref:dolichol kinase n=1 Tax=Tripterygium wilfordii TaxID=458696 RepID=A0A7J7DEJ8_TRIWF|nr:dolichol kinase EVAN isoform X2 [Tripterygium wilfordii]KAF5744741.1 dolichol kinase isoform X1 [Tripterygium wilfordii]
MAFSSSVLNGERAVVVLFIGRVLYSLPLSFLVHGLMLSLLAAFALYVEVRVESSNSPSIFRTRPGVSSGILLGAVTVPTVMLSKLIQLSRAFSLHQVELGELYYMTIQYWATSASCFSVLVFICLFILRSPETTHAPFPRNDRDAKFSSRWIALCAAACCMSLALLLLGGLSASLKFLWVLCHGLAAIALVRHFLTTFPSCVSIGEALLVTTGLVLYFGDMLTCTATAAKFYGYLPLSMVPLQNVVKRTEIAIINQGLLLALLLFPIVFKYLLRIKDWYLSLANSEARRDGEIAKSLLFFSSLGFMLIMIAPSWIQFVEDFHLHPFLWVISFVFSEPFKRLSLCFYWVSVIYVSVLRFYNISKNSKIERILLRKYYHLMAVSMFLPALIFQPEFLDLAFGAALAVFLGLEIIRVWRIWPLGKLIHEFMNAFTDHRDSDLLIISHFSLLLGCALPIWMSAGYNDRPLAPFAGILSLGIGDTMASVVGYKYGVLRWSKTGKKTIEGTAAGITSVLAACSILLPLLASTGYILSQHWFSLLLAVTVSGLLEAYTAQLDNAFIPLVFYSLLCL